jgi:uncharacterized sodium:solute symporter family permease YidK
VIGASLLAANISAHQIIVMVGSGYAIGLLIAAYEWMAAITLIAVVPGMAVYGMHARLGKPDDAYP